ncbi:MAG: amino acid ABC transporter permease [Syntrophomonas sp.]
MNSILETIVNSVQRNLLAGNAYLTVLQGLWVTVVISALGLLFGTICGAILCSLRMSKMSVLRKSSQLFIAVLRGSPVLLLLMILYYVAFANSRINPEIIAVIAFALNSGAHIAELMRSALEAVDKKQLEAARMLGFSKFQAFLAITLPQASKIAKPVYQGTIVNTIQWTSVVGYVTITDLTRTVDSIGNRTGDPFFSLFCGVLLYLGLSYLVYGLFAIRDKGGEAV